MKTFIKIIAGITVAFLLFFIISYWTTSGEYNVPKTTTEDVSLPGIEFDGYKFHAQTFGSVENSPIILLHGGPGGDYRGLLPLMPLANDYFLVFYDQRGSGLSPRVHPDQLNLEQYIKDLNFFVDSFAQDGKVNLFGHSWGAMLATAYTSKYPEKVNKLMLAEPGFLNPEMAKLYLEKVNYFRPKFSFPMLFYIGKSWFRSLHIKEPDKYASTDYFMFSVMMSPFKDNPIAGYFCNNDLNNGALDFWRFGAVASASITQSGMDDKGNFVIDFADGIENFHNKVLIISGACNTIIGEKHQKKQLELFNKAELKVIQEAGHTMMGEKPKRTINAIKKYMEEPNF